MTRGKLVREALHVLGIRRLLLGVHDAAFPGDPGDDLGRGTPYSRAAEGFLAWVAELGFDGLQLGPSGLTTPDNPSPYDGTWFSRHPGAIGAWALGDEEWGALLAPQRIAAEARSEAAPTERADHRRAHAAATLLLREAFVAFRERRNEGEDRAIVRLDASLRLYRAAQEPWLARDALFEALQRSSPGPLPPWPGDAARAAPLLALHAAAVEEYAFTQLLLHLQHRQLQATARRLGLALFADMQVGMSPRDEWAARALLLPGYRLGAPPSRTNPEGQAWNYAVLHPAGLEPGGPAAALLRLRLTKLLDEQDGLRIDHPHGLVCPWVYREGEEPGHAVRHGARLYASPDLPDHRDLARYAIARPEQLDRSLPRHHNRWERELEASQVDRYARVMDLVLEEARNRGRGSGHVACEVLSTEPLPLRKVVERYGLGRFRVLQKADLGRADDGYRGENARPEDWVLLGNHDTPTIWQAAARWVASGAGSQQAAYLAGRLGVAAADREAWVARVGADPRPLAQARFADLFVGPAAQVLVSFGDLFGLEEPYNLPGEVAETNWTQRVPRDFRARHGAGVAARRALDLPAALAAALRARRGPADLVAALERSCAKRGEA